MITPLIDSLGIQRFTRNPGSGETGGEAMREMKVACIFDDFSYRCFEPECQLIQLSITHWATQLDVFQPELILWESAWQGLEGKWGNNLYRACDELCGIALWAAQRNIPIVFWNKEDPYGYQTFLAAARIADYVFTTDIDCRERYRQDLQHENVHFLHFAAQPSMHNPIEKYDRLDSICFAGAYYQQFPERNRVFDSFYDFFTRSRGMEIFDRNQLARDKNRRFPAKYQHSVKGTLKFDEIDRAYKGYRYGLNMNSITASISMFARRVFELMASNTVVVSNYSCGLVNYFGELVICSDDMDEIKEKLELYCGDDTRYRKYRLLGLRKIMGGELFRDRLQFILEKIYGCRFSVNPSIACVGFAETGEQHERITTAFNRQRYERKKLYLVSQLKHGNSADIVFINPAQAGKETVGEVAREDFVAVLHADDYYGPFYLTDGILATRYTQAVGIGKGCYYEYHDNLCARRHAGLTYQYVSQLEPRSSVLTRDSLAPLLLQKLRELPAIASTSEQALIAIDEFNYCRNYPGESCAEVDDMLIADQGRDFAR